ncbi:GIY-YIG nuclease family protein [Candidatus Uhrbacteria bacterium]|nr:GIY-YIG nuclease family protein [Candidatus Uhrbacteria bacterium]
MNMYFVYFIKSASNSKIYCGSTDKDSIIRLAEHNRHSNQWTKSNGPFELVYYEKYLCKHDAINREKVYKTGFGRLVRDAIIQAVSAKGGFRNSAEG